MAWKTDEGSPVHQDNAPAHKSVVAMAAVRDCGFELSGGSRICEKGGPGI